MAKNEGDPRDRVLLEVSEEGTDIIPLFKEPGTHLDARTTRVLPGSTLNLVIASGDGDFDKTVINA